MGHTEVLQLFSTLHVIWFEKRTK